MCLELILKKYNTIKNNKKMPIEYTKGKIYKIVNDIDSCVYIGSTTIPLNKRIAHHRNKAKNTKINSKLYTYMRNIGINNFNIVLIEYYPCNNREELVQRERYHYKKIDKKILLNKNRPTLTIDELKNYKNDWYKNNIEHVERCRKNWIQNNMLHNIQIKKNWYNNNKQYIVDKRKKYHQHNKLMKELPFYRVP